MSLDSALPLLDGFRDNIATKRFAVEFGNNFSGVFPP